MKNHTFHAIGTLVVLALTAIQSFAQSTYEPYAFTTLAGGRGFISPDRAGRATFFDGPNGVAVDSSGNLYVADTFNHVIQKVSPDGVVTTFAGVSGVAGNVDDAGSAARLNYPIDVTIDNAGNLYIAEGSHTIRKVTPVGEVTTLAGLAGSSGSADGTGSTARFFEPHSLAVDALGNVFVADFVNSTVRKITPEGVVTTIAGRAGSNGSVNGLGSAARFYFPQGIAVDGAGTLYVSDTDNGTIRKVAPVGTNWMVTTIAGLAGVGGSADGTNGAARFVGPKGCGVDAAGNIYVADNDLGTIRKVTPVGTNWVVTTLAGAAGKLGSADGIGSDARFSGPFDVTVDSAGNLFVAEGGNPGLIRKLALAGTNWVVTTAAGLGGNHGSADGTGRDALFQLPSSLAVDSSGNIYVADQGNSSIRKVTSTGVVTTLAGLSGNNGSANGTGPAARFFGPSGVTVDGAGNLYVTDTFNSTIRKVTPGGVVTTFAGTAGLDGNGNPLTGYVNATGAGARFYYPTAITIDGATNLYIADSYNGAIRKVTSTRVVSTVAGSPHLNADGYPLPGSADGVGTAARFFRPSGIAVDSAGNIYVADTFSHIIRKIDTAAVVSTLAGVAGLAGNDDGIGAVARFNYPSGLALDSDGNLYIADSANNTIRKMTPGGVVTTLGGMPGITGSADGQGSVARFYYPAGVALDGAGTLYVADYFLSTIRKGYPPPRILNFGFIGGQFRFDLTGPPGLSVIVEASPDLVSWLPIWTNTFVNALEFIDSQGSAAPNRFYRARFP